MIFLRPAWHDASAGRFFFSIYGLKIDMRDHGRQLARICRELPSLWLP